MWQMLGISMRGKVKRATIAVEFSVWCGGLNPIDFCFHSFTCFNHAICAELMTNRKPIN